MNYQQARHLILGLPDTEEDFPFGPEVAVMKLNGKMFATLVDDSAASKARCNLKCDPDEAVMLRDIFEGVSPGYHMNKRHWNTISLDADVPDGEIERMIEASYRLVFKGLSRTNKEDLIARHGQIPLFEP